MFVDFYDHAKRNYGKAQHHNLDVAQWLWEIEALAQMYASLKPARVLEIGTWQGGTLYYWLRYAAQQSTVISMDENPAFPFWSDWMPAYVSHVHLQGNSHDAAMLACVKQILQGQPLDFLFIDADHTDEGATLDFEMYGPLVRKGGMIALHDILDPAPERNQDHVRVSRLWKRIQQAGYVTRELIGYPAQDWGGIGVVLV